MSFCHLKCHLGGGGGPPLLPELGDHDIVCCNIWNVKIPISYLVLYFGGSLPGEEVYGLEMLEVHRCDTLVPHSSYIQWVSVSPDSICI